MTADRNSLVEALRAALRDPWSVPQAELATVLAGRCALLIERRSVPGHRPRSIVELPSVRIAG